MFETMYLSDLGQRPSMTLTSGTHIYSRSHLVDYTIPTFKIHRLQSMLSNRHGESRIGANNTGLDEL